MNSPVKSTARAAPGEPREACGAPPDERMAFPKKKVARLSSSQKTTVITAVTPTLVAKSTRRFGVAARVVRMVPLAYSPVMRSAPNTPAVRATVIMPIKDSWVGSNPL